MFAIPGIVSLVVLIYARPQEFFEWLRVLPLLYVSFGLAVFGGVLDLRVGNVRFQPTPQLRWVAILFAWSAFTILVRAPGAAREALSGLSICVALYLLIAHGVQTFRALNVVAGMVLVMVLLICGVGTHQGFAPVGCVVVEPESERDTTAGRPDGRPCESVRECYSGDAEPGADYACEHIGLLGTTSVGGGRVRYRGVLQDPNELALAGGVGLPLAFAGGQGRGMAVGRKVLAAITLAVVLGCVVLTQSRAGQLVLLAVLATYGFRRFGWVGTVVAGLLASPLLLLGGRSGAEASSSTMERLDCWWEALSLFRAHPIIGVGLGQFGEHNYMTAHNSYLLALAELGFPGMVLFGIILYLSAKVPIVVLREVPEVAHGVVGAGAAVARPWAMALLAAFAGLAVGIFFLSFTYHYVLWIYLGLSGALYSAVRTHLPDFQVRFGLRDLALVGVANGAIILFLYLYTRAVIG